MHITEESFCPWERIDIFSRLSRKKKKKEPHGEQLLQWKKTKVWKNRISHDFARAEEGLEAEPLWLAGRGAGEDSGTPCSVWRQAQSRDPERCMERFVSSSWPSKLDMPPKRYPVILKSIYVLYKVAPVAPGRHTRGWDVWTG